MFIFDLDVSEWLVLLVCAVIALLVVVVTQHLRIRDLGREVHDVVRHAQMLQSRCEVCDDWADALHEQLVEYVHRFGELTSVDEDESDVEFSEDIEEGVYG